MRLLEVLAVLLAAAGLGACSYPHDDRALVTRLEVLGVRAEPPEVAPGGTVVLDSLIADPLGEGRLLLHGWGLCTPDPVLGLASCADAGRTQPISASAVTEWTVPADALDAVPPEEREAGLDLFAIVQVRAASGDESATAFKRIRVSTAAVPNRNPAIASLVADASGTITVSATADSREATADGVEQMRFTWWTSAGSLEDAVTIGDEGGASSNVWISEEGESPAMVWVVLRDPRGGSTWTWTP